MNAAWIGCFRSKTNDITIDSPLWPDTLAATVASSRVQGARPVFRASVTAQSNIFKLAKYHEFGQYGSPWLL